MKIRGIIAVLLCAVMLTLAIMPAAFADNVEIDVGDLFTEEDGTTEGGDTEGGETEGDTEGDTGKVNIGTVDMTKDDDDTTEEENPEEKEEEPAKVPDFPDVKEEDWFYSDVRELASMGVVNGHDTGLFDPHGNVTRAEFIKMVVASLVAEDQMASSKSDIFEDVKASDWHHKYIITAIFYGFIDVKDYGAQFKPDEAITRSEVAKIIAKSLKVEIDDYKSPFADTDDDNAIALYGLCLMQGELDPVTGERLFKPDTNIERCEVSAVILRLYKLVADSDAFYADFYEKNPTYEKLELLYAPQTVIECYTELTNAWGNSQAFLAYDYEYTVGSTGMSDIQDSFYKAFI